jgi:hypothetical protein
MKYFQIALIAFSTNTYAFFGPITFSPVTPTSNDNIQFSIESGVCDAFVSNFDAEIELVGSTIKVTKSGTFANGPTLCNFQIRTTSTSIGRFPAGSYRFELYRRRLIGPPIVELVQTSNLTVRAAPLPSLVAVPMFSSPALILLIALQLMLGRYAFAQQKS